MTLTQLHYAVEVARAGSINKAANNLFTSQSAVSTALHNLESELQRPIFLRNSHGVSTTPFGKAFISYVAPVVEQIKSIDKIVNAGNDIHSVSLSLSSSGWTFLRFLQSFMRNITPPALRLSIMRASMMNQSILWQTGWPKSALSAGIPVIGQLTKKSSTPKVFSFFLFI